MEISEGMVKEILEGISSLKSELQAVKMDMADLNGRMKGNQELTQKDFVRLEELLKSKLENTDGMTKQLRTDINDIYNKLREAQREGEESASHCQDNFNKKINEIEKTMDKADGAVSLGKWLAGFVGGAILVGVVTGIMMYAQVNELTRRMDKVETKVEKINGNP